MAHSGSWTSTLWLGLDLQHRASVDQLNIVLPRGVICSTRCPCLSDADWCLQSDVVPDSRLFSSTFSRYDPAFAKWTGSGNHFVWQLRHHGLQTKDRSAQFSAHCHPANAANGWALHDPHDCLVLIGALRSDDVCPPPPRAIDGAHLGVHQPARGRLRKFCDAGTGPRSALRRRRQGRAQG